MYDTKFIDLKVRGKTKPLPPPTLEKKNFFLSPTKVRPATNANANAKTKTKKSFQFFPFSFFSFVGYQNVIR